MGFLMTNQIDGVAADIETIARLRPWLEEEARKKYGYTGKTKLVTDYDEDKSIFKFKIIFPDEP
jgi:hypothetical protein